MNQNEAGDIETIILDTTQNDEPFPPVDFSLEEKLNRTLPDDKGENLTHTTADLQARMSLASENTAVMQLPVSSAETNASNCGGSESQTLHANASLSLIATTNAATSTTAITHLPEVAAAAVTPTTAISMPHLNHAASAPLLNSVQLRANIQQQQKIKNYHDAKQTALWDASSSTSTGGTILKASISSVYATPRLLRKSSESGSLCSMPRRVSFPKSDNELVTGYLEPANPWEHVSTVNSANEIVDLYTKSCHKHNTKPLQEILEHLKAVELNKLLRQPSLSLKNTQLLPGDCEALEEVLKRVQYKCIDLSSCELEESALTALCDIIEYYEAANELNISSNPKGMTPRGWSSCANMVGRSQALQVLNAEGNPISKSSAECLGNALCTSNLHTIKLEHCGLKGPPLMGLCLKIRHNRILKELWLAHNDLDSRDAESIAELLRFNHFLELVDISNNNIGDEGLKHIVQALIAQSKELERRSMMFQRAAAIESDDIFSPVEVTPADLTFEIVDKNGDDTESTPKEILGESNSISEEVLIPGLEDYTIEIETILLPTAVVVDDNEAEEDTEDTVKSNTNTVKPKLQNPIGGNGGQSMLDKLLSMNSDSSSEEGASNLSTDTIAACGSEDASFVSDDIFDVGATGTGATQKARSDDTVTPTMAVSSERIGTAFEAPLLLCAEIGNMNVAQTGGCSEKTNFCDTCTLEAKNHCKCRKETVVATSFDLGGVVSAVTTQTANDNNQNNNNRNNNNNNTNNNNNNISTNLVQNQQQSGQSHYDKSMKRASPINDDLGKSAVDSTAFEITADDRDCLVPCTSNNKPHALVLQGTGSTAVDVNKNSRLTDDYDDTHSTDSAFESASEGDISRHLPEEFTRFSASLESTRLDDITNKELAIETATIATESTECLNEVPAVGTMQKPPLAKIGSQKSDEVKTKENIEVRFAEPLHEISHGSPQSKTLNTECALPKVTVETETMSCAKDNEESSPIPTPPPPATSPGGAGLSMRRTDSSCNFIMQSTRNHSHSSDSLCSDNSLDGSVSSDLNLSASNERFTKNDTLTRQLRQIDASDRTEPATRSPVGLKALAVWNNNLTKEAGINIAELLADTSSLELLNIGKNILSNDFIFRVKESLTKNTTLTTLGLQSAHLSANGIEALAAILSFGGNSTLQRIDIRDNKLEAESLSTLAEALKSNTTVTQIDIDDEPKRLSVGSDAHLQYTRVVENVRSMCSRNEKTQAQLLAEKTANSSGAGKRRSGYYVGSRKISLTCHSRPLIEYSVAPAVAMPPSANKLEVKRKSGVRLRSPVPSPPTISPSSSPSRSRFQVCRVSESSPLTSPLAQTPPAVSEAITVVNSAPIPMPQRSASMSASTSLPSMATATSSTQTIKRPSSSRSSRFHVSKIYEDPKVPIAKRSLPPITPPIHLPPSPMLKSAPKHENTTNTTTTTTSAAAFDETSNAECNSSSSNNSTLTASSASTVKHIVVEDIADQRIQSVRCPIAVFNENDITLTHDAANEMLSSGKNSRKCTTNLQTDEGGGYGTGNDNDNENGAERTTSDFNLTPNPATQQVARKLSCPTAVDKLLTLFNPVAIFQRSTSPEPPKILTTATTSVTESTNSADLAIPVISTVPATATSTLTDRNSVVKHSPPSWSKLGSDILNLSVGENEKTLAAIEQPRSFLDAASKQLRDLGKQVFRQNTTPAAAVTQNESDTCVLVPAGEGDVGDCRSYDNARDATENNTTNAPINANELPRPDFLKIEEDSGETHTLNTEKSTTNSAKPTTNESTNDGNNKVTNTKNDGDSNNF